MYSIVEPKMRITSERDFNDLVFESVLFELPETAKKKLEQLFPGKRVSVDFASNGDGFITVGDVAMRVWH